MKSEIRPAPDDVDTVMRMSEVALLLEPDDDVAITTRDLAAGTRLSSAGGDFVLRGHIPRSHKFALRDVPVGGTVHKYGQSIGSATADIVVGDHVHSHNLGMD